MKPKRNQFETDSLGKMGKALGWDRTSYQGVQFAHKTEDKKKAVKGEYSKGEFVPGAGHVDDEAPHRGWLGIGGSRD